MWNVERSRIIVSMENRPNKNHKGLKKENLRDNMTNLEIALNILAEASTTELYSFLHRSRGQKRDLRQQTSFYFYKNSLKHPFAGLVSKLLETDGLRTVVQYDIVGVRYYNIYNFNTFIVKSYLPESDRK